MNSIENKVFDLKENLEKKILTIENKEIPEQKYINICEKIGNNNEYVKKICRSFDINLKAGFEKKNIDIKKIYIKNGINLETS